MNHENEVSGILKQLLASSYTLYLKTQNYHWNVTGPMFSSLHTLFEDQYTEMATAVDEIAERIRALGDAAPGSFHEFEQLSAIESTTNPGSAEEMIKNLAVDSQEIAKICDSLVSAAEQSHDEATADLAIRRIDTHQKNAWMLNSHLE